MNILIYGDSNTYGQIPNINGYSLSAVIKHYNLEEIWWGRLIKDHRVSVNALPGRAICNDNPWLAGRNATETVWEDLKDQHPDLTMIQLGTNDCKSRYKLSAKDITMHLENLIKMIAQITASKIMVISPARIVEGNQITDTYYQGAKHKTESLDVLFHQLCQSQNYTFVSGLDLPVGEDGEHLTSEGHKILGQKVAIVLQNMMQNENLKQI